VEAPDPTATRNHLPAVLGDHLDSGLLVLRELIFALGTRVSLNHHDNAHA
jgi:hypothetical protein